ncbi:MAG: FkbM family methyltransferase [Rhizomicrobium sp.]
MADILPRQSFHGLKKYLEQNMPRAAHRLRSINQLQLHLREPEIAILKTFVDPQGIVIDVGANVGIFSEFFAARLGAKKVLAIEPIATLAEYLRKVLPANVEVLNLAFSDHAGETKIRIPQRGNTEFDGWATIEAANVLSGLQYREETVTLARLDDRVAGKVGFIKIDVEGHEAAVLRGAERVLRESRPNLLIEIEARHREGSFAEVMSMMKALDYHCYYYNGEHLVPVPFVPSGDYPAGTVPNYLFLS